MELDTNKVVESSYFKKAMKKAAELAQDGQKVLLLVAKSLNLVEKLEKNMKQFKRFFSNIRLMGKMLNAYFTGEYKDIPWVTIIKMVGGLIYFLSPIDLIPDVFIGLGFIDDAAVVGWVIASINSDIERFRAWDEARNGQETTKQEEPDTIDTSYTVVEN